MFSLFYVLFSISSAVPFVFDGVDEEFNTPPLLSFLILEEFLTGDEGFFDSSRGFDEKMISFLIKKINTPAITSRSTINNAISHKGHLVLLFSFYALGYLNLRLLRPLTEPSRSLFWSEG